MIYLRQSTAGQEIVIGQALDSTDGNTVEAGLTIANTDIKLHKHGTTTLASKNSGGATYISNGVYYAVLDATDTDTAGGLTAFVHVSGALAMKCEYMVLLAASYDALFSDGLNNFDPNSDAVANVTLVATTTTNTDMRGTDSAATAANLATVDGIVDAILVDTGTTIPDQITALNDLSADEVWDKSLAAHQTPLSAGRAVTLGGVAIAETTATGTPTTSSIQLTAGSTTDDFYNDMTFKIVGGTAAGQARVVSNYIGATKTCEFDEVFVTAPSSGDAIAIALDHVHPVSAIATATRQEMDSGSTQLAAIVVDTNELQANQGDWVTATGFATPTNVSDSTAAIIAEGGSSWATADVSSLALQSTVAAILVDTGTTIPATLAGLSTLTAADILYTAMTESYAAAGAEGTLAQVVYLTQQHMGESVAAGLVKTVKKLDGSTTAATFGFDDATDPTSVTRT